MKYKTSDLCDQYRDELQVADPDFINFGAEPAFHGQIATLSVRQDFLLIKQRLTTPGQDRVLVIDGDGFMGCALLGDSLAAMAIKNGWAGAVINGCIRDSSELVGLEIGILALGACPIRPAQLGAGEADVDVTFSGIVFRPGEYLYADQDGVVTSPNLYQ